jgi:ABC-type nitrate/sulfonate/bicarbonate transport system substrate-binding protein
MTVTLSSKAMSWAAAVALIGAVAAASGTSRALAQEAATAKITVGTSYPGIESMAIYIARRQGYFRDERLSVDLISLATGDKIAFALLGGSIDVARYTPDWIIRAIEKGSNLKIVLGGNNTLLFSLIAAKDIKSYADLKGKRIGVSALRAADALLVTKMFAANGLSPSDYILIQAGSSPERAAALRAGSLSATVLSPPTDQRVLDEAEFKRLDLSTNVVPRYAWGGEAIREDWARSNKPALLAYMRAWIRASRFLRDPGNKEEVIGILAKEAKMEDRYARAMYELYVETSPVPVRDGQIDLEGYKHLLKDMTDLGQIGPPAPPADKYIDQSYWEEARRTLP